MTRFAEKGVKDVEIMELQLVQEKVGFLSLQKSTMGMLG
jgi:hypothetical protein